MRPERRLEVMRRRRLAVLERLRGVEGFGSVAINGAKLWVYVLFPDARSRVRARLLARQREYVEVVVL